MNIAVASTRTFLAAVLFPGALTFATWADVPAEPNWPQRVEEDWLVAQKLALLTSHPPAPLTTASDAAGGCDGVKNGEFGFHTGDGDPWWQVDLGRSETIAGLKIWNRGAAAERAYHIRILLSEDGREFRQVYQHDGTPFHGLQDDKPLVIDLKQSPGRFIRVTLPGKTFLHLDEVEAFSAAEPQRNIALHRPADQSSLSQWSVDHTTPVGQVDWCASARESLAVCDRLPQGSPSAGPSGQNTAIELLRQKLGASAPGEQNRALFLEARRIQRRLALENPLLRQFDTLLFTKRVPGSFNHMSDQYYGWWSKPGGGIYLLRNFLSDQPAEKCLTSGFKEPGSFLRPTLSYDGSKVLFAWCRYHPQLAGETNKLQKSNVPEDAFYHLFEMNIDGSGLRQITRGKYDDFDGRYLPDGRIVFLSTRRGQSLQAGRASAARTLERPDLPDCYVRCGGGPERPVAVYTLHTMKADGTELCAISPFEMFEWTPEIARDGTIIYSRWDYIDRDNMPYMGLWAINPDGSSARMIYKNYTKAPHCTFEAKPIPGSSKIVFTASAHHAQTMGSLVLLDPAAGLEGSGAITRLTPEVEFPEIEGWPATSYANPWPLNERFYLVAWGFEGTRVAGPNGWDRWHAVQRPKDGMALYLYDAVTRARELIWADPEIACGDPIPVRARERPPVISSQLTSESLDAGSFLLTDVYRGLTNIPHGTIKALRIVAVPAKTHPTMNFPNLGITADDPGKCVLGTVPVDQDGSAYFQVPPGVILFFQALDARGVAIQTMRSVTHVQAGQTLSCIGCHEHRQQAPPTRSILASARAPSRILPGPDGSWPLRFDRLVQPVLNARCVSCHRPESTNVAAAKIDLSPAHAYDTLVAYGKPSLRDQVWEGYRRGFSIPGEGIAERSALRKLFDADQGHNGVLLEADDRDRLITWMDTYAQRAGHFSEAQERELTELRGSSDHLLADRTSTRGTR
jgi:hypothetical protein